MTSRTLISLVVAPLCLTSAARAGVDLIAISSVSGAYEDLASKTAGALENGAAGNRLGGIGSGLAWAGGNTFLALPDRGPNAETYNPAVDNTTSYIPRFQSMRLSLAPNPEFDANVVGAMSFVLSPTLRDTPLLSSCPHA